MPLNVTFFKFKFIIFALIIVVKLIKTFFIVNSSKKINDQKKKKQDQHVQKEVYSDQKSRRFRVCHQHKLGWIYDFGQRGSR